MQIGRTSGATGYFTEPPGVPIEVTSFEVFEVPRFTPTGSGPHNWALIDKTGRTTPSVARDIARWGGVRTRDVGYAGLKDKWARTVQWFSSPGEIPTRGKFFNTILTTPSRKKLKPGNLLGNWFRVKFTTPDRDTALSTLEELARRGVPNFYGPQRFSTENARIGRLLISGERQKAIDLMRSQHIPLKKKFFFLMEDAYKSLIFNKILSRRLTSPDLIDGDVKCRYGPSGPVLGEEPYLADGPAGKIERDVIESEGASNLKFPGRGHRRPLFVPLKGLKIKGPYIRFFLPKGSYATSVMREVFKRRVDDSTSKVRPQSPK